jgi:superfamily II DNA or RNA helicase
MGSIVVSTMQSFKLYDDFDSSAYFHGVIIDEAHHVTDEDGTYGLILQKMLAPIRLGFTATAPTEPKAQFALEGLIGPLIGKLSIKEAGELDILAKPKIKLVKTSYQARIEDLKSYESVYTEGIVKNRARNREILDLMWDYTTKGMTVLILVTRIDHGEILKTMAENRFGMQVPFVQGETISEDRENFKKRLDSKELKAIIATTVWREGINIPSLNVVINAAGGKSEIMTLQAVGRGLRKTKDKEEVIIVDFFDPSHFFLIRHFGERVTLYMDNGWL